MSKIVREMTREELIASNNALRKENKKLKAELQAERNLRKYCEERNLRKYYELHYGDTEFE